MKDTTFANMSDLKMFSIGIVLEVASTKKEDLGKGLIKVSPVESMNLQKQGRMYDPKKERKLKGNHPTEPGGISGTVEIKYGDYVLAQYLGLSTPNRTSPPTVYPNESVMLYKYGNEDKYYWSSMMHEAGLRKRESANFQFSNIPPAKGWINNTNPVNMTSENSLNLDVTGNSFILTTPKNDGEGANYTVSAKGKEGEFEISDGRGQSLSMTAGAAKLVSVGAANTVSVGGGTSIVNSAGTMFKAIANSKSQGLMHLESGRRVLLKGHHILIEGNVFIKGDVHLKGELFASKHVNTEKDLKYNGSLKSGGAKPPKDPPPLNAAEENKKDGKKKLNVKLPDGRNPLDGIRADGSEMSATEKMMAIGDLINYLNGTGKYTGNGYSGETGLNHPVGAGDLNGLSYGNPDISTGAGDGSNNPTGSNISRYTGFGTWINPDGSTTTIPTHPPGSGYDGSATGEPSGGVGSGRSGSGSDGGSGGAATYMGDGSWLMYDGRSLAGGPDGPGTTYSGRSSGGGYDGPFVPGGF